MLKDKVVIEGDMIFCKLKTFLLIVVIGLCIVGCGRTHQDSSISYEQFPDVYLLTNSVVTVAVCPTVGRIVGYHFNGEENLIWLGKVPEPDDLSKPGWKNYGGDKIWATPQELWEKVLGRKWPPDVNLDGEPWKVISYSQTNLVMQSEESEAQGVVVTRTLTLPDESSTLQIDNNMVCMREINDPSHIWAITQIVIPESVTFGMPVEQCWKIKVFEQGWEDSYIERDKVANVVQVTWPKNATWKIGCMANWLSAVYPGGIIFLQYTTIDYSATYADDVNTEFFVDNFFDYAELETLSPSVILKQGEEINQSVTWKILRNVCK